MNSSIPKPKKPRAIFQNPPYFPSQHFFCLYRFEHPTVQGVDLARDAKTLAIKRNLPADVKVKPVALQDLIKERGHSGTTDFLKEFGLEWTVRAGNIFYKRNTKDLPTA